jgi:hypothetical protein
MNSLFKHILAMSAAFAMLPWLPQPAYRLGFESLAQEPASNDQKAKPEDAKKPEDQKPEDKPFSELVKDMETLKGLFTLYSKTDDNKLLMEILPEQIDKIFLFAGSVDKGIGERGLYGAQMGADFPFFFRRVGKNIQWIMKGTSFTVAKGHPAERATQRSFPDAILGSAKIVSKPHPERNSVLIDVAELLVNDLPGFTVGISRAFQPATYKFDKANSALGPVRAFPENILFEVWLHFNTDNPRTPTVTLPDPRSIPIAVKYEFSQRKETGYKPRLADDRVGHFVNVYQDFSSDRPSTPYVRYINRWHLEKADPTAKLSLPKVPIVFWLENTIPHEYRDWFKEGVLLWNRAFEKIGFKDVLVVKQQPDDADWDPADTRYNTIRWFATVDAAFAIGPSRANPFTGQIYDADIGFSEAIIRSVRREAEELVGPVTAFESHRDYGWSIWNRGQRFLCNYAEGLAQQAAFGLDVLDVRGALSQEVEDRLMREWIIEVTAHEVGHTLGLRHNFRASSILKPEELYDIVKTSELSQSSSVMDYNPIVVAGRGEKQGHFVPVTLGPYDYWAVQYAYQPIDGDEKAELAKIAARASEPLLPYSTDEDALGTYAAESIDPLANQFDQSGDPLGYFRKRLAIVNELWNSMETKLPKSGEGYQVLRRAMGRALGECNRAFLTSSKFIGGIYHYRDHVGDPNGRLPFSPVPAAKQREALNFLRQHAFSEKAFQLPASLHNKLAIERLPGLNFYTYYTTQRIDFPWHQSVLGVQRNVLSRLYHPILLARLVDNEVRFGANQQLFTMANLFDGLNVSIWSELDSSSTRISTLRRNLQREQLRHLVRLTNRPVQAPTPPASASPYAPPPLPPPALPDDATTLARASLLEIQTKVRKALGAGKQVEATTRAHLQEIQSRITSALQAQMQKPAE